MKRFNLRKLVKYFVVLAMGVFVFAPMSASAQDTATLHVVVRVINHDAGTLTPADFIIHVRQLGSEVPDSPAPGLNAPGRTYVLAPGTYVITQDPLSAAGEPVGYSGDFTGVGFKDYFLTLNAGDDVTITRTNDDFPIYHADATTVPPVVTPEPTTETGGTLPATASPWYNILLMGAGLVVLGAFGLATRSHSR